VSHPQRFRKPLSDWPARQTHGCPGSTAVDQFSLAELVDCPDQSFIELSPCYSQTARWRFLAGTHYIVLTRMAHRAIVDRTIKNRWKPGIKQAGTPRRDPSLTLRLKLVVLTLVAGQRNESAVGKVLA